MAKPMVGAWRRLMKIARYLVGRKKIVRRYDGQEEGMSCYTVSDSDWGRTCSDRTSTSGGAWFMGGM